jgi:glycosyltransferase involved in cell wall biosynthesis
LRIGFDLRPAQGPSAGRGIGRYTRSLLQAMVHESGTGVEWTLISWPGHSLSEIDLPASTHAQIVTVADETQPLVHLARQAAKKGPAMLLHRALDRRALRQIARRERFDVLLLPALFERAFYGVDHLPCPVVKVCHDLGPHFSGQAYSMGGVYAKMYRQEVQDLAQAEAVIAISEAARQDTLALSGANPVHVHVIYQGIDPIFRPMESEQTGAIRQRFSPDMPFFLASGGLEENKNLETVVDALGLLRTQGGPTTRLLVLGAPPEQFHPRRADLTARAEAAGLKIGIDVLFLPRVNDEDLAALYAASVALVFPSRFEGFGLPPAECMACGSPIIVSDTTSLPEVAGDAGVIVGPEDAPGIAAAMARLRDDAEFRRDRIARGLKQAARFTWPQTARETLALLRTLTETHHDHTA